ncbi:MAG: fibronectin type III domain-containing protein [Gallionellaceae bacterium]|nr:MAG: fibronectin type III domain-containing protein [Gallionellaceae bacterium]
MQIKYRMSKICALLMATMLLLGCGGRSGAAIKATSQTISFSAAPALSLNGTATVAASASSGLAVSYSSITPAVCSVHAVSGLVGALATGTCIVAADQSGNDEFAPAAQVVQNLAVAFNPNQTISFGAAPGLSVYGTATVAAAASSGLAVSYSSATPVICSVDSRGVVTDLLPGNCVIAANQAGNAGYNPAPQTTQTLAVAAWSGALTLPAAPTGVAATLGNAAGTVTVSFIGSASSGGSPVTAYTVTSVPTGISVTGAASPLNVPCAAPCSGYAFTVVASNGSGNSPPSAAADVLTNYNVTATFYEPDTQPNNSVFTGSFTVDSTTRQVLNLKGALTESMTHINDGQPMTTVALVYQLAAVSDGQGGLLVSTFALNTTDTFSEGGNAAGSQGLYYGYPSAKNPAAGGVGNSYATIYVNLANPAAAPTSAQVGKLAYGDCAPGGMMGDVCMTGYAGIGTMGGFPLAQTIAKQ